MYAFLKGKIEEINGDHVVVDVHGVGYRVFCDLFTLAALELGKEAKIMTSLQTTKDGAMTLYGFADRETKNMFELLITVSGVGAKGAVKILSKMKFGDIVLAVMTENDAAFRGAASPKIASRIIIDLKKKVEGMDTGGGARAENGGADGGSSSKLKEASQALVGLGYTQNDALNSVKAVLQDGMSVEDIIFQALKQAKN